MMKSASKSRYYQQSLTRYMKRNLALILLAVLFLAGILSATLLFADTQSDVREYLLRLVNGFAQKKLTQELRQNFLSSFFSSLLFVGVLSVCGFCAVSQPVVILLPLFRGLGVGFSIASLYAFYGAGALGFVSIYTASALLSTVAMLLCCVESLRLSCGILSSMRTGERAAFYPVRRFLSKYLAAMLLCVFAAALEAILYTVFAKYVGLG